MCVVCVHLPHSGRPLQDLIDASQSLQQDLQFHVDRSLPIVLLGDLNVSLVGEGTDRSHLVLSTLDAVGLHHFSHCTDPTRTPSPRRLDHIVYTDSFLLHCAPVSIHTALPWVAESYRWDAKECLGVDHVLIAHDVLVKNHFRILWPSAAVRAFPVVSENITFLIWRCLFKGCSTSTATVGSRVLILFNVWLRWQHVPHARFFHLRIKTVLLSRICVGFVA